MRGVNHRVDRSPSVKRKAEQEKEKEVVAYSPGGSEEPFQEVQPKRKRKQRKVQYGTSNVRGASGATAEAAPYKVFIGNTHPDTTNELIKEILVACASDMKGD